MIENQPTDRPPIQPAPWKVPRGRRSTPICTAASFYARVAGLACGTLAAIQPPRCWLCEKRTGVAFTVKPPPRTIEPIPFPDSGEVSASICRRCARSPSIRYYLKSPAIPARTSLEIHT